jgi:peptidoglycan hydrolase-like protein with peptidoglycan-binding domain
MIMKIRFAVSTTALFVMTSVATTAAQYPGEPSMPGGWKEDPIGYMRGTFERGTPNDTVRQAQDKLRELGYYAGESHGVIGPAEKRAIWNFQKANSLHLSGSLDPATLAALGLSKGGGYASPGDGPTNFGAR